MIKSLGKQTGASPKKPASRVRIFGWALLFCAIAGAIGLFLPVEDIYRGARNHLRARPADQKVVVVAIDNKTVKRFGSDYYSRRHNAEMIDRVFAMGANRVFFDEAFSRPLDEEGDNAFADALARHPNKVYLGAASFASRAADGSLALVPMEKFRTNAKMVSLVSSRSPFSLSIAVRYEDKLRDTKIPSMASEIAGFGGSDEEMFTPDWAIQVKSVPTVSLVDLLDGKVPAASLAGKDVVVGVTSDANPDFATVVGQGWFPGVYVHTIGAQTLREGRPVNAGWIPALLASALASALLLRARRKRQVIALLAAALTFGIVMPFVTDALLISVDYLPAYLMFLIVVIRSSRLRELAEARLKNAGTLMPNLSALREEPLAGVRPIIAMRIRNYAAVCASFADQVEDELVLELSRRLSLPGEAPTFYQAEDVIYWMGPPLPREELQGHLEGLGRLVESQFVIRGRKLDIHVAFGVDNDQARSVASRIGRALLAADTAAMKHQLIAFSTLEDDEERAWELSLMSELDAAIDAGDIWVAYQPQFDIRGMHIFGVEALVRWQHPARGAISPEAFIGPAESHNRMMRLTLNILKQATASCKTIVDEKPGFRLSVNLSASLLEHPQLPELIGEILYLNAFPASNLTLEVTESAPFAEHNIVSKNLTELAAIGIELSIDDYGTGNATLEYLRTVPCQEIKIDRRFVLGLADNFSDRLLVESTIELAHGLGRRVIAEGIEDAGTLALLKDIGCDIAQGYFLAKPMRIQALREMLDHKKRVGKVA